MWLYQSVHSAVASSTCARVRQGHCGLITSVLNSPMADSIRLTSWVYDTMRARNTITRSSSGSRVVVERGPGSGSWAMTCVGKMAG